MRLLINIVLIIGTLFNSHTYANESGSGKDLYYLAIKGGISLGSYESGINWMLLKNINKKNNKLISFSGASAGSINSLISALNVCFQEKENISTNNLLRASWDIDIEKLLSEQKETNSIDSSGSLFNRNAAIDKITNNIKNKIENTKAKNTDCDTLVTMSVTRMFPHKELIKKTNQTISSQRFVLRIRVKSTADGQIVFENLYNDAFKSTKNDLKSKVKTKFSSPSGYYISLPDSLREVSRNHIRTIEPEAIMRAVLAASAFPLAFSPIEMRYCFVHELKKTFCIESEARKSYFSDGGLFDNAPIGVALEISQKYNSNASPDIGSQKIVFIDPDNYRKHPVKKNKSNEPEKFGFADYAGYLLNSFDTATSVNYNEALKLLSEEPESHPKLIISERYHPLLADFHAHFGAFFSKDFRSYDFLTGIYDGIYLTEKIECENKPSNNDCIRLAVAKEISSINILPTCLAPKSSIKYKELCVDSIKKYSSSSAPDELNFIKFLYNQEFDRAYIIEKKYENKYIALYSAFTEKSKPQGDRIDFATYITKLKHLLESSFANVSKNGELNEELFRDYQAWLALNLQKSFENLNNMQRLAAECDTCVNQDANKTVLKLMNITSSASKSFITHIKTSNWPLDVQLGSFSTTFRYGFDIHEKAQVFTLAARYPITFAFTKKISLDLELNRSLFGSELKNDDYWSISSGFSWHFNNMAFPTVTLGYQHSFEGRNTYKDTLDSVYISAGILNETIHIKYAKRNKEPEIFNNVESRASYQFQLQFDVIQISKLIYNAYH